MLLPHKFSEFEMLKKSWQKAPKDKNLSGFESKNEKYREIFFGQLNSFDHEILLYLMNKKTLVSFFFPA